MECSRKRISLRLRKGNRVGGSSLLGTTSFLAIYRGMGLCSVSRTVKAPGISSPAFV